MAHVGPGVLICFAVALLLVKVMYSDVSKFAFPDVPEVVGTLRDHTLTTNNTNNMNDQNLAEVSKGIKG